MAKCFCIYDAHNDSENVYIVGDSESIGYFESMSMEECIHFIEDHYDDFNDPFILCHIYVDVRCKEDGI